MKTVDVTIKGDSPLLIHRFTEQAEAAKATRAMIVSASDPREVARQAAYIAADGTFYFSAASIPNAMANAGANHKMRGSRKSLRFIVPSAVRVAGDAITILNGDGKTPAPDFEVDARPVTIPATKGRVMRYRPRFNQWSAKFRLQINDALLDPAMAQQLLTEAGQQVGIGDFRPEKRGPFGCFQIVQWK